MAKQRLVECTRCSVPYPEGYLQPVIGAIHRGDVCGVCALQMINAIHGTQMRSFHGEMAEDLRWMAVEWRRRNPVLVQKAREVAKAR